MSNLPRVIVWVRGGVVQAVSADTKLEVIVWDADDVEDDPDAPPATPSLADDWDDECAELWHNHWVTGKG